MDKLFDIPEGTDIIPVRKSLNQTLRKAKADSKPSECILCGREQSSFCNSHSVPQMVLREISDNGYVLQAPSVMGFNEEIVDCESGVKNSGTFSYICRECDGSFFQEYENPNAMETQPTDKMLAEIAVKNFLLQISKRKNEKALIPIMQSERKIYENPDYLLKIKELDEKEYLEEIKFHKEIADSEIKNGYQIIFWEVLQYKIPLATQFAMALSKDMNGDTVNEIYDLDENVRMQYLHLCAFPLPDARSVVLLFYHRRDRLYRKLRHQFNSNSNNKNLQFINYLIFAYGENYFISKKVRKIIDSDKKLNRLAIEYNGLPMMGMLSAENNFGVGYIAVKPEEITNFLSEECALENH